MRRIATGVMASAIRTSVNKNAIEYSITLLKSEVEALIELSDSIRLSALAQRLRDDVDLFDRQSAGLSHHTEEGK